jgi:hypothetical protein
VKLTFVMRGGERLTVSTLTCSLLNIASLPGHTLEHAALLIFNMSDLIEVQNCNSLHRAPTCPTDGFNVSAAVVSKWAFKLNVYSISIS